MASQEAVAELKVEQLKELAAKHNVEVASSDKKEDLVKKVSAAITPEDLEAYNKTQADESGDQGSGDAPEGDSAPAAGDGVTPPVAANPLSPEAGSGSYLPLNNSKRYIFARRRAVPVALGSLF